MAFRMQKRSRTLKKRALEDLITYKFALVYFLFADAFQVTDGTGAMRAACMNEQERDTHFHRVSGNGQMSSGQWRPSLT